MRLVSLAVALIALVGSVQADLSSFNLKSVPHEDVAKGLQRHKDIIDSENREVIKLGKKAPEFKPVNLTPVINEDGEREAPKVGKSHPRTIEDLKKILDLNLGEKRNLDDLKDL